MTSDLQDNIRKLARTIVSASERVTDKKYRGIYSKDLANYVFGTDNLRPNSITGNHVQDGSFTTLKVRDFAAEVAKIVVAEIETAQIETAQITNLSAEVATIVLAVIETADIVWANIASLTAAVASIATAVIQNATIGFGQIDSLVAGTALITQGVGGKIYIHELAVTEANMVSLSVGELMVVGANGKFYQIQVDENGNVYATEKKVDNGNIGASVVSGENVIAGTITARELNVASIFADEALINAITAQNIDVASLFANTGFITSLHTNIIESDIGATLDISSNEAIISRVTQDALDSALSNYSTVTQTATSITSVVSTKADKEDLDDLQESFDALGDRVSAAESAITQNANQIALNVSQESFDALGTRVSAAESTISQHADQIALKVSQESFDALGDRVAAAESAITQNANQIALKVSQTSFDSLGNRVSAAESAITQTPDMITAEVSRTSVGARNYIPRSDFSTDQSEHWSTWGSTTLSYTPPGTYPGTLNFTIPAGATGARGLLTPVFTGIGEVEGEEVTLSFHARCTGASGQLYLNYVYIMATDGGDNAGMSANFGSIRYERATEPYKVTFVVPRVFSGGIRILIGTNQSYSADAVMRISEVKLEKGNKATDWCQARDEFYAGSSITLTPDEIKMRSAKTTIEVPGALDDEAVLRADREGVTAPAITADTVDAITVNATNLQMLYIGPSSITVDKNGATDEAAGTYRTLSAAFQAVNDRVLTSNVSITLTTGQTFTENVTLKGVCGSGSLTIGAAAGAQATLKGSVMVQQCSARIVLRYLKVQANFAAGASGTLVNGYTAAAMHVSSCVFNGNSGTNILLNAEYGTNLRADSCEFYNATIGLRAGAGTFVAGNGNKGSSLTHALYSYRGILLHAGTIPTGSTTTAQNGILQASTTTSGGTLIPVPTEPELTTATYTANLSGWFQTNGWPSEVQIRQGRTAAGEITGCVWFPSLSALSGKTVQSATLRLRRKSGYGCSGSIGVWLYGIAITSKTGSSAPSRTKNYGKLGTIGQNETKTFDIPTSVITNLAAGTIAGLALYAGDGSLIDGLSYSQNYGVFFGTDGSSSTKPMLAVEYT